MGKSFRKNPGYKQYGKHWTKHAKRQASKAVRKYNHSLSSDADYKRVFESWEIHDFNFRCWQKCETCMDDASCFRRAKNK